ncbi:MAG TPA: IS1380 family transposase, partial [Isosphaeraceae bacterium]|nr:IS1380 family transposase [Isosphaeraceae bacterium]
MSATIRKKRAARQKRFFQDARRRIKERLANIPGPERPVPMMTATNIHYERADRVRGLSAGGIGALLLLARKIGLDKEIDRTLHLLKRHLPYHESDHVLNIAFNLLAGGKRIEHLELRRNDEVYLDALGAERIPDPTTAGDFCRRFSSETDVLTLINAINESRLRVWAQQPDAFRDEAILDADGTIVETEAECKQGVDISYDRRWGYHPLLVSLANTAEPLFLLNRSGNRPSQERAGEYLDKAVALCTRAGFRKILLRGDTRIAENKDLDTWDDRALPRDGTTIAETGDLDCWDDVGTIRFIFGYAAYDVLKARADALPDEAYSFLERPPRYAIKTWPRQQPERVKPAIIRERGFKTIHLLEEMIAEFDYQPVACRKSYRMIVLRKRLATDQGQMRLFEEYRYFFYITNDRNLTAEEVVFLANDRCDQENLIAQLTSGVPALTTPVDNLVSNWAY